VEKATLDHLHGREPFGDQSLVIRCIHDTAICYSAQERTALTI
jgi:hypothetical protein